MREITFGCAGGTPTRSKASEGDRIGHTTICASLIISYTRTSCNLINHFISQHISPPLVRFGPTTMSWVRDRARSERPSQAHRRRSLLSSPSFLFFPPTIPVALDFILHVSSAGVHTQTRYGSKSPYRLSQRTLHGPALVWSHLSSFTLYHQVSSSCSPEHV